MQASLPLETTPPAPVLGPSEGDARHGDYLASIFVCRECHTLRGPDGEHLDLSKNFAGGIPFDGPWGTVETANVSMVAKLLPARGFDDIIRGRMAYKFQMPTDLYNGMAADDMRDLIAYLRSLPPTPRARPHTFLNAAFTPPPPNPEVPIREHAPTGRTRERGEYLVTMSICKDCHSPRSPSGVGYDLGHFMAGGGFAFRRVDHVDIIPPNLTPDAMTGIGTWSEDDIVRAIKTGIAKDGHRLNPFMPYSVAFFAMTDDDAHAIAMYLKTIPPVRRTLPDNPTFAPTDPPASCCFSVPSPNDEATAARSAQ